MAGGGGGGGGQQQDPDNGMAPLWVIVGVFVVGALLWHFFSVYIIQGILTLRLYEADLVSIFVPAGWAEHLSAARQFIATAQQTGFQNVSFNDLLKLSTTIGDYLRYPVALILMALAVLMYLSNPIAKFKKTYSMKSLLNFEKQDWPYVMPVAHLNLIKTDIDKGPWAMALPPMAFAKKNEILVYEKPASATRFEMQGPITATINRDDARRIFALQVGRYWSTPEALPIHARALFAVFAARSNGDREGATQLLDRISRSIAGGKIDYSGTDALLSKHKDNKHIIRLTKRHAFEFTVMASMLEFARQDGVLGSADFLWLKPVDRRLWFMLNCVGRQTPFPEVAGAFCHWICEKEFGKRLNVPMVEEAVNGLEVAIKEIIYHPDEEDDL